MLLPVSTTYSGQKALLRLIPGKETEEVVVVATVGRETEA